MKPGFSLLLVAALLVRVQSQGQGTFVYDQQSADEHGITDGGTTLGPQPTGQSFIPAIPSVGFIRLYLSVSGPLGATVCVNLRTDDIAGNILSSTEPVFLPFGFSAFTNLFFSDPPTVNPGTTYYFQPALQSGSGVVVNLAAYLYPDGTAFVQGVAQPSKDLWFREGIVVPEPRSWMLALLGMGLAASHCLAKKGCMWLGDWRSPRCNTKSRTQTEKA